MNAKQRRTTKRLAEQCVILLRDMPPGPARDRYGDALAALATKTWTGSSWLVVAGRNVKRVKSLMRAADEERGT